MAFAVPFTPMPSPIPRNRQQYSGSSTSSTQTPIGQKFSAHQPFLTTSTPVRSTFRSTGFEPIGNIPHHSNPKKNASLPHHSKPKENTLRERLRNEACADDAKNKTSNNNVNQLKSNPLPVSNEIFLNSKPPAMPVCPTANIDFGISVGLDFALEDLSGRSKRVLRKSDKIADNGVLSRKRNFKDDVEPILLKMRRSCGKIDENRTELDIRSRSIKQGKRGKADYVEDILAVRQSRQGPERGRIERLAMNPKRVQQGDKGEDTSIVIVPAVQPHDEVAKKNKKVINYIIFLFYRFSILDNHLCSCI